jgi:cytochrome c5
MKGDNHMSNIKTVGLLIALGLVVVVALAACGSGPTQVPSAATAPASQPTQAPTLAPTGASALDGAMLLDTRCSSCHPSTRAKQAKKTLDEWNQTVTRMIGKGAQLTDAEKTALVDYLAKTYGP